MNKIQAVAKYKKRVIKLISYEHLDTTQSWIIMLHKVDSKLNNVTIFSFIITMISRIYLGI